MLCLGFRQGLHNSMQSMLASVKCYSQGFVNFVRASNHVCGVGANACERKERPSSNLPSEEGEEYPEGVSRDPRRDPLA